METNADSLHVALPISLKAFLDRRVAEGRYGDVSEYISDLVRADEEQAAASCWNSNC
jgi:putative addiction module CopG family antidote